jgi:hypothetical protein
VKRSQVVGLLLWRGGLLLVAVAAAVELVRALLTYFELPVQLELGSAMIGAGVLFVILSMILERTRDARTEGDLSR